MENLSLDDIIKEQRMDHSLENLLMLNGDRIIIDEVLGLWVKFDVKRVLSRKQGIRYSLSLHDKNNIRILGFDNAHEIEFDAKRGVALKEHLIIGILM